MLSTNCTEKRRMAEASVSLNSLKTMAQKVRFVSFDVIQYQDKEMKSHWYRHEDSIDLYYFQSASGDKSADSGRIVKLHLSVMGQILEWNPYDGVRTGLLIEEERAGGVFEIIQYDLRANEKTQAQCLLILNNAFLIESEVRERLIACVENQSTKSVPATSVLSFFKKLWKRK